MVQRAPEALVVGLLTDDGLPGQLAGRIADGLPARLASRPPPGAGWRWGRRRRRGRRLVLGSQL